MSRHLIHMRRGFTLIELVVIMVILGILAAVAVPVFFDVQTYKERAAFDELASALRYAQKLAVASGCEVRVEIDADGFVLYRHLNTNSCGSVPGTTIKVTDPAGDDFENNEPVPITMTPTTLVFDAMGRARDDSYIVNDFVNVANLGISVVGETGYVDVDAP